MGVHVFDSAPLLLVPCILMDMSVYKDTYVYNDKKQLNTIWISINKLYITYVNYTTPLSSTAVFISNMWLLSPWTVASSSQDTL